MSPADESSSSSIGSWRVRRPPRLRARGFRAAQRGSLSRASPHLLPSSSFSLSARAGRVRGEDVVRARSVQHAGGRGVDPRRGVSRGRRARVASRRGRGQGERSVPCRSSPGTSATSPARRREPSPGSRRAQTRRETHRAGAPVRGGGRPRRAERRRQGAPRRVRRIQGDETFRSRHRTLRGGTPRAPPSSSPTPSSPRSTADSCAAAPTPPPPPPPPPRTPRTPPPPRR